MNRTLRNERRFDRGAWLTLIIMIAYASLVVGNSWELMTLPGDGWQVHYNDANSMTPSWKLNDFIGNWQTPLQTNDVILAVGDIQISQENIIGGWTHPAGWGDGGMVKYTVLRAGQTVVVEVPLHRLELNGVLHGFWQTMRDSPDEWVWLLVGFIVFLMRPQQPAARLLLVMGVSHNFVTKLHWASTMVGTNFASSLTYWLGFFLDTFWGTIFWPSIILLILSFPIPLYPLTRWPRSVPVFIYGFPTGLALLTAATKNVDLATLVLAFEAVLMFLAFGAACVNVIKRSNDAVGRAQVLWVVFGFMISIGLILPLYLLDYVGVLRIDQFNSIYAIVSPLTTLFLPISLGIAITKYRLFDIQVIIRKTLVYSLLTTLLALVYFGSVTVLQGIFTALGGSQSPVITVISTLAIAALFTPLRRRIQDFIDRRFYRTKYDAEQASAAFAASARSETDLGQLSNLLTATVQRNLQPELVSLWLRTERRSKSSSTGGGKRQ